MMKMLAEVEAIKLAFGGAACKFIATYNCAKDDLMRLGLAEDTADKILGDLMNDVKKTADKNKEMRAQWEAEGKDPAEESRKLIEKAEQENPELMELVRMIAGK